MREQGEGQGRRRGPRIALCGAGRLERYPESLIKFITGQPADTVLLLRSPSSKEPGLFEQVMAKLAITLWLDVEWFRPDLENGSGATFLRDVELVRKADLVLCYFHTTTVIGGTAHVVEKAMDVGTPVYAYGLDGDVFRRVGEDDPEAVWSGSVPE